MLNIEKKLDGNTLTVALEGRLDTTTAPSSRRSSSPRWTARTA